MFLNSSSLIIFIPSCLALSNLLPAASPAITSVVDFVTELCASPPSLSMIFCASLRVKSVSDPVRTTFSPLNFPCILFLS